jgi:hypothetical protein
MVSSMFPTLPSDLERVSRQNADALLETIVRAAKSPADVPRVLDRVISFMCDEWSRIDWEAYGDTYNAEVTAARRETRGSTLADENMLRRIREFLDAEMPSESDD